MTEAEAAKSGRRLLHSKRAMARVGRAVEKGESQGFMKIVADADTRRLLGAAILGTGGDEAIHGILQFAAGDVRVLHRVPGVAETEADDEANATRTRVAALREQAERASRMANVLSASGFAEEVAPALNKAIGHAAAAMLANGGALPAGATVATAVELQDLKDRGALPPLASRAIEALTLSSSRPGSDLMMLLTATAAAVAALGQHTVE